MTRNGPPNYTYRAEWDSERCQYRSRCLEFTHLQAWALTPHEAVAAMEQSVAQELVDRARSDWPPPESLTDHRYSGRFLVRTSQQMHANLMVEAAEQGVSFNHWVACKLAGRRPPSINDLFD